MIPDTVTVPNPYGRDFAIPADDIEDWRYEVASGETFLGLTDWFQQNCQRPTD